MPKQDIELYVAGAALLILIGVAILDAVHGFSPSGTGADAPQSPERPGATISRPAPERSPEGQEQGNQAEPQPPIAAPDVTIEDADQAEASDGRRSESEQREKEDLIAQQTMAEAALEMLQLTKWQIGLGSLGAALLLTALFYSALQTKAATKSADAALNANQLNREFFIADQRAWLNVNVGIASDLTYKNGHGWMDVHVIVTNTGRSPATYVYAYVVVADMVHANEELAKIDSKIIDHPSRSDGETVFPGDRRGFVKTTILRNWQAPTPIILLYGRIVYELALESQRRQTKFNFMIMNRDNKTFMSPELGVIPKDGLRLAGIAGTPRIEAE